MGEDGKPKKDPKTQTPYLQLDNLLEIEKLPDGPEASSVPPECQIVFLFPYMFRNPLEIPKRSGQKITSPL